MKFKSSFQRRVVKDIKKFFPKSRVSNLSKLYYTSLTDKKYYLNNSTYCYFFIKDGWENKYNFKKFLSKNYTVACFEDGDIYDDGSEGIIIQVFDKRFYCDTRPENLKGNKNVR